MPFAVALLLVVLVHLAMNLQAWTAVGLVADDRFAVGLPILCRMQGLSWPQMLEAIFLPTLASETTTALYRPFAALLFCCEEPWFGVAPAGYHAVNSVFHCTTAMLWFLLVRRWTGSAAAATAAALAFTGWPGHAEATHWISARVNLMALCFASGALVAWDGAERAAPGRRRTLCRAAAALLLVLALGSKESAIVAVPLAFLVSLLHAPAGGALLRTAGAAAARTLPLVLAFVAWACLRRFVLHTWGAGTNSAWQLEVLSPTAWLRAFAASAQLLLAPVHADYGAPFFRPILWALHGGLLTIALTRLRGPAGKPLRLVLAGLAVAVAATAGLTIDPEHLTNARYSYEPALFFCLWLGFGIAALPSRSRGPVLALLVLAHAVVLDGNRQNWLRAGGIYARMERDVQAAAAAAAAAPGQPPIQVLDAPGMHDGAFVYLVERSELLLWPPFAPTVLAGRIRSAEEWQNTLRHLAAEARRLRTPAAVAPRGLYVVAWDDGSLVPVTIDASFPQDPRPGTTLGYARVGRERPFLGTLLPVQVLLTSEQPVRLGVRGTAPGREWHGEQVVVAACATPTAVRLMLPVPADLPRGQPFAAELLLADTPQAPAVRLDTVQPVPRRP